MSQRWNWLRNRLTELGSNPSRFAKELGWPPSRVYELFSGKTKAIPLDKVAKAANILSIRLDSMLNFNSGMSDDIYFCDTAENNYIAADFEHIVPELDIYNKRTPTFDSFEDDGTNGFLHDDCYNYNANYLPSRRIKDSWRIPADYLKEIDVQNKNAYIIEALGDSMSPTISAGDKAIIDTSVKGQTPSPAGVFAIWDGLGVAIKRIELIPNSNPQMLKIIADNPKHSSYECRLGECHILGRVASIIKKL